MRISDWSSDVCSSDLAIAVSLDVTDEASTKAAYDAAEAAFGTVDTIVANAGVATEKVALGLSVDEVDSLLAANVRSEEHTSELQSLMRISYAVFCLKKKKKT